MAVLAADPTQATSPTAPPPAVPPSSPPAPPAPSLTPTVASAPPAQPDIVDKVNTLSDSQRKYFFSQMSDDQRTRFQQILQAKIAAKATQPPPAQPPKPGFFQNLQNKADASVGNGPQSVVPVTAPEGSFMGNLQHLRQGIAQGVESVVVHPVQTAHSAVELPMDVMRATGTSPEFIGQHESDPEVQKQIQAARDRLTAQWQAAKANPYGTAGQLIGGGLITHGLSELTDAGLRATGRGIGSTVESATGASDLATGAAKSVQQAGEKAIETQAKAGRTNATALKGYAADVDAATQTIEEQKAAAAKKVADWTAEQQLNHATQVEHLQAQQAADNQAANITSDQARQKAQQLYAQNVQDVQDLDSQRGELARQEKQARLQLMRTIQQGEEKAHTAASDQFNEVRDAIGPTESPVSTLEDAVRAAVAKNIKGSQEKIPTFQDMLRRAQNTGEQADLRQNVMATQGLKGDYNALPPDKRAVVDKWVQSINANSGAAPAVQVFRGGKPEDPNATFFTDNKDYANNYVGGDRTLQAQTIQPKKLLDLTNPHDAQVVADAFNSTKAAGESAVDPRVLSRGALANVPPEVAAKLGRAGYDWIRTANDVDNGQPTGRFYIKLPVSDASTMSWDNWRGYSSELGKILQNPNLETDVRGALQDVKDHVDAVAQKMADDVGVGDQFRGAMQNWNTYKQIFHEPEGPSGSGSRVAKGFNAQDVFNATQPFLDPHEEVASRARNMLVGDPNAGPGGYFNPGAGKVVDRLRDIVAQQETLPKGKIVEPPQIAPDAEPLDIRQIKLDAYQRMADRLKYVDKWQVKLMAGVAGGLLRHTFGGNLEQALTTGLESGVGVAAPLMLGRLMDVPAFREWVSKPRPRDFELLNKLNGADKIRVKDDMTGQIVSLAEAGQRVKVSPQVQAFVGPENIMKIARAITKAKGTVAGMTGAEKIRAGVKAGVAAGGGAGAAVQSQQNQPAQQQPATAGASQ